MPVCSSFHVAPTGHTLVQAGFSQCWQATGQCCISGLSQVPPAVSGALPPSVSTRFQIMSLGMLLATLHTTEQVLQPEQRLRSMTIPYLMGSSSSYS